MSWRVCGLPAAAERGDQRHAAGVLAVHHVPQIVLGGDAGILRRQHVQVGDGSSLVLVHRDGFRPFGRRQRRRLHAGLLLQQALRGQIVFDALQRRQHGLAVAGHAGVVVGDRLLGLGAAQAGVEQRQRQRRADRPDAVGQRHPVGEGGAAVAAAGAQRQRGEEGGFGDADLGIGDRHIPFRRGHVRPALQQRRGDAGRNLRQVRRLGGRRQREAGRRLAELGGDRVLQLGAGQLLVHHRGLRGVPLAFRRGHSLVADDAGGELVAGQLQRLAQRFLAVAQIGQLPVGHHQLQVGRGELGLAAQSNGGQLGLGGLLLGLAGLHFAPHRAPQIHFPAGGQAQVVTGGRAVARRAHAMAPGRVGRQRREQAGLCLAQLGLGRAVLRLGLGDGGALLVQRVHQAVQRRVLEHRPPVAARHRVLRLGALPAAVLLELGGNVELGPGVVRADRAAGQRQRRQRGA
ncbi:hypothetical protein CV_2735 [Chromobacterium violaceum ATCC 12472]|uniref:Uncharacterized protein n=1 Tax=Chromobacterium violaceum (strain ATCC 12472 / DSM 30191 / JCM 1249 / CCUG 213 / NBRC 12614 / NCIMB 9131 / NCTC 9757 / MK) TaxID=243365 RepID=Q7NUG3_CHRVO|nr:hypothetical protein CV_2735 [Chromobacterium violaceum ATCC 12472]